MADPRGGRAGVPATPSADDGGAEFAEGAGGPLLVGPRAGAGAVVVATDRMHAALERCRAVASAADEGRGFAERARAATARIAPPDPASGRVADELAAAIPALARVADLAMLLHDGLAAALASYELGELARERALRGLGELVGAAVGVAGRSAALLLGVLLAQPLLVGFVVSRLVGAGDGHPGDAEPRGGASAGAAADEAADEADGIAAWFLAHPEIVSDPAFVSLVGLVATSSDDAVLAALGLPPSIASALGENGLGLTGVALGAAAVIAGGSLAGVLRETPVAVTRTGERPAAEGAPTGSVDRLSRVPGEHEQIRIEHYSADGRPPRWIVYVSPTVVFDVEGSEPHDLTSNVHGVAGGSPGALRAVELAMHDAGIAATDEVQFVGFSQGGMIAARAVETGNWNAVGVETYGAPVGNVRLPEGLAGFTVRHTDDLVPALAGPDAPDSLVHVERRAYGPGDELPHIAVPPHQKSAYLETARLLDDAESELVRRESARLGSFAQDYLDAGGSVDVLTYHAERVPPGATVSGAASR